MRPLGLSINGPAPPRSNMAAVLHAMPTRLLFLLALAVTPLVPSRAFDAAPEDTLTFATTARARLAEGSRRFDDSGTTLMRVAHGTTLTYPRRAALLAGI